MSSKFFSRCFYLWIIGLFFEFSLSASSKPLHLEDATIPQIHAAFAFGQLTCSKLIKLYLNRIDAYNEKGPALKAVITVNPKAMEVAEALDAAYKKNPKKAGKLHCIPVLLKDNYNTFDMPTSSGSVVLKDWTPPADAFVSAKFRKAGAVIIGKANLSEFAWSPMSNSSRFGQVRNPYELERSPGGSSGGSAAGIAADLAVIGTGSDTISSIRQPASANDLVGVRATRGLVSRSGIMPLSTTQDIAGTLTRSVIDAAIALDVIAGYDPTDPVTAYGIGRTPSSYTKFLNKNALKGARIGLLTDVLGKEEFNQPVNQVMDGVVKRMTKLGAAVVRISLPDYAKISENVDVMNFEARTAIDEFLASNGPKVPVGSLAEVIASKTIIEPSNENAQKAMSPSNSENAPEYKERLENREKLRISVAKIMADNNLDAILYPIQSVLVGMQSVKYSDPKVGGRNGFLAFGTGYPAVTFPGGFSAPTETAPLGVPVGAELLGPDFSEGKLFGYAYAFEQGSGFHKPPKSTPPLEGEP